jgi:hypothetical protein
MKPLPSSLAALAGGIALLVGAAVASQTRATAPVSPADRAAQLDAMHAACVDAMVRSTCKVMAGPAASSSATVVFVAGIGPVDAAAYRELRASGDAMCSTVSNACKANWDGPQCRTGRGLFGSAPPAAPASAPRYK